MRNKSAPDGEIVLVVPDLHCPFHHPDAFEFLKIVKQKFKPTKIVLTGDEMDFHTLSRWPRDPDGLAAGQEFAKGAESLIPLYRLFAEALVCTSNHTIRPFERVQYPIPEKSPLPPLFCFSQEKATVL